jgi:hypothetical protein
VVQEGEVGQLSPSREIGFNEGVGKRCAWASPLARGGLAAPERLGECDATAEARGSGGSGELIVAEKSEEKRCVLVS